MLFLVLELSNVLFILLINVKMPTLVGILTFLSSINMLSLVGHEKSCITSWPSHLPFGRNKCFSRIFEQNEKIRGLDWFTE